MFGKPAWNRGINQLPEKERKRRSEKYKGSGNPNYGKKHSEEAKQKIRDMRKLVNPNGRHKTSHTESSKKLISQKTKNRDECLMFLSYM